MPEHPIQALSTSALQIPRRLITSSVVRGSQRGESHGGLCIVDVSSGRSEWILDWNTTEIDV